MYELKENDLVFAKVRPDAIIPTKRDEDMGRDVYANFSEDYMIIPAHTTKLIPTGIASALNPKYGIRLRDRGSNGSKGIHVNCGSIDSGFRNEWFVAWCNTNDEDVILSKISFDELMDKYGKRDKDGETTNNCILLNPSNDKEYHWLAAKPIIYPYSKAIAQAEVTEVPVMNQQEISYEELKTIPSERGCGMIGSSGK